LVGMRKRAERPPVGQAIRALPGNLRAVEAGEPEREARVGRCADRGSGNT
jgi:hypothetical protein